MEVVSEVLLRVVSNNGVNVTWLKPDEPRDLPDDMAHYAVQHGATFIGRKRKKREDEQLANEDIVAQAVQHLTQHFDSLGTEHFAADGRPRLSVFRDIPGMTAALRDAAWDDYTMNPR
jgi:hypothetical protein